MKIVMRKTEIFIIVLSLLLLLAIPVACKKGPSVKELPNQGSSVMVTVKQGMNTKQIAELLVQRGLLPQDNAFLRISKTQSLDRKLQAGQYKLTIGMTEEELVTTLGKGAVHYNKITIPEGYNVKQIAELLQKENLGNKDTFLKLAQDYAPYSYMQTNDPNVTYKAEGFLFPSTYNLPMDMSEQEILAMLVTEFDRQITPEMRQKLQTKNMSIRTLAILASLVEKEAQVTEDRPIIAGVFLNRLKVDMPLQSCATIQYILGYPKAELTIADTKLPSVYNTYLHSGLPPAPIANAGLQAIKAAVDPAQTNYMYFVVGKGGKHHFSVTYEEHLAAIEKS